MKFEGAFRFVKNVVKGEEFLNATGNKYAFVSQKPYKGKLDDTGEKYILPPGVILTLQITEDHTEPLTDKITGKAKDNMVMANFEATIANENITYPLNLHKGQLVSLKDFKEDFSYYIDGDLLMRFGGIELVKRGSDHENRTN